jgi:lipid-binding SYLF domain-containing protein
MGFCWKPFGAEVHPTNRSRTLKHNLEAGKMRKQALLYFMITLTVSWSALASSSRMDDIHRIEDSAQIFQEIMGTPDHAIPQYLLDSAQCIAIVPSEMRFAFILGGNYGKGLVTCRSDKGWSAPVFLSISGGSVGFQAGGSSTDYILVFRGRRGLDKLFHDKFRIGGDASAAAGPVGRNAAAGTDIMLHAEILTYSRSRGVFAGVSLTGAVIKIDQTGNQSLYGANYASDDILDGKLGLPADANVLVQAVTKATRAPNSNPYSPATAKGH